MADIASSITETLAAVPLFARMSGRQRSRLATLATTREYRAGSVIVRQGDTSMSFYVVLSGRVRIQREHAAGAVTAQDLGPAGFFGEMGLIDDLPRAATAVAVETSVCALLAKWDFQNALRDDPEIALALLPVLNRRIRTLEAEHETSTSDQRERQTNSVPAALARAW